MKYGVLLVLVWIASCSASRPVTSPPGGQASPAVQGSAFDYSVLGRRFVYLNPVIWSRRGISDPQVACEQFREAKLGIVRIRNIIASSRVLTGYERAMVGSEKYQILSYQIANGTDRERQSAEGLLKAAEGIVKHQVSVAVEDALKNGFRADTLVNVDMVMVGDSFDYLYPVCPELFHLESGLVYYIDNIQKI